MVYTVYFADNGSPASGLSLEWESLYYEDTTAVPSASYPSFTEVGGGWYKFDFTPSANAMGVVDGSSALTSDLDRYVSVDFKTYDGYLANLDTTVSSRTASSATVSANIVQMNGVSVTSADFQNTQAEISAACVLGIEDKFSFSGDYVNVNTSAIADRIMATSVDTKTVEEILEILLSFTSGKIVRTNSSYLYYKQDNSTSLFTLSGSSDGRSRV